MVLYTGKGDGGTTKLFNTESGVRISKSDTIFEALGTVDELNTIVGWCRIVCSDTVVSSSKNIGEILLDVQQHLFTIQAELAGAEKKVAKESVLEMEKCIENIEKKIPKITSFCIPGSGGELSARLDVARATSRRAERILVALHTEEQHPHADTLVYINRLSSLFYALVRMVNHTTGTDEQKPTYNT